MDKKQKAEKERQKKKTASFLNPMQKSKEQEEAELVQLRQEIEEEQQKKDGVEFQTSELEKSVRKMENNVIQLEAGNLEADDSEIKQKYDNQKQLNIQLAEQKRWLEHELEQIKLKIQNEKMNLVPDPFALDWDALSETEMKRLVVQLEKTRNDLRSDLREMEWRLDKEGREYHHYEDFCKLYRSEILNLNRMLDMLSKNGMLPGNLNLNFSVSNSTSASNSFPSTGQHTPGSPRKNTSSLSPPIGRRMKNNNPGSVSPTRKMRPSLREPGSPTKSIDPKLGAPRKTAAKWKKAAIKGVRNLPKIEKKGSKPGSRKLSKDGGASGGSGAAAGAAAASEDTEVKNDIKPAPLGPLGSRRTSAQSVANSDQPSGLESLAEAAKEEE